MDYFKHYANALTQKWYDSTKNYPCFVYVCKTKRFLGGEGLYWNGYVKIGVTNDVGKRLKSIQTGCPHKLEIYKAIICYSETQAYALESYIHNKFKKDRLEGEWFKFSTEIEKYLSGKFYKLGPCGIDINEGEA